MKRPVRFLAIAVSILAVLLLSTSCDSDDRQTAIEDGVWNLQSFGPLDSPAALIAETVISLEFDGDSGELEGTAGCNHYAAQYRIEGENLTIGELGWTEIECSEPAGVMAQEQTYLSMLERMRRITVEGEVLSLSGADEAMTFTAGRS